MTPDCLFCQIAVKKLPCWQVYQDQDFLGFLDIKPLTCGNSLLIPKKHCRWVLDVPKFGAYWQAAKKVALASQIALKAHSISFLTLGYEIPHAHIRIIPRFPNDPHRGGIKMNQTQNFSEQEMKAIAEKIRQGVNN